MLVDSLGPVSRETEKVSRTEPRNTLTANHGKREGSDRGVSVGALVLAKHVDGFGGGAYEGALKRGVYWFGC